MVTHIFVDRIYICSWLWVLFVGEDGSLISAVEAEGSDGKVYFEPGYTSTDSLFGHMEMVYKDLRLF